MPTYEYACDACRHQFEQFQSISAEPLKKCPACGKSKLRRLIGAGAGVIFKGSGFYTTDYRSESYKKSADADKPAESKSSDTKDAKTDSTPAAKPADAVSTPAKAPSKPSSSKSRKKSTD